MCRNIKMLFNFDPPVTDEEIRAASLQFVRKVSGFNKPAKANEAPFLTAVDESPPSQPACSVPLKPMRRREPRRRSSQGQSPQCNAVRDKGLGTKGPGLRD